MSSVSQSGGGGGGTWGSITGTLSAQTDLQDELNLKAPKASPTFTGVSTLAGFSILRVTSAGNVTLTNASGYMGITSTAAARTVTLPAASTCGPGQRFWIEDESGSAGTNNITVSRAGSDTINGATTFVINQNYGSILLTCDGTSKFFVISYYPNQSLQTSTSVSSNINLFANNVFLVNTSVARTLTLPSPVSGTTLTIKDATGLCNTNNITVNRFASEQIEGVAAAKIFQTDWGAWVFWANGTNWFLI